jgi:1-acyl-sn-glycerol-3-phosphate acyltransferase
LRRHAAQPRLNRSSGQLDQNWLEFLKRQQDSKKIVNTTLRYAQDHRSFPRKLLSWIDLLAWTIVLMGTLLFFNIIQCLSFVFYPISKWGVWKINRECADLWWRLLVFWTENWLKIQVEISGDEIPPGESVLFISNHQQMPDIPILMTLAIRKGRLGDMKWFVKDSLKYIPGIGWGMYFLGCVFLKRNWYADFNNIQKTFARLRDLGVPFWLVSFVEGTRITPGKLKKAQAFARAKGYPLPQHTLIPKRKGFATAIHELGNRIDAVYDATIFYDQGIATLFQMGRGLVKSVKLHVKRYPLAELPQGEEAIGEWLRIRYQEKDQLLAQWET